MKSINHILLFGAGIVLSLVGCQKGPDVEKDGNFVRFGAYSGSVFTRTSYGDDGEGYQMINWTESDQILIWSDKAINRAGQSGQSAVYELINIHPSGKESTANVNRAGEDGLVYLDDNTTRYQFWGIYPADKYLAPIPTAGSVSFNIPAAQVRSGDPEITDGNIVEKPNMSNAISVATSKVVSKDEMVNLKFYPAFTAFEFELKNNTTGDIVLRDVTLSCGSDETAIKLAGDVTATLATADGKATKLELKEGGAASNTVKYSFGNGSGVTVAVGKSMMFTIFTTGVSDMTGLAADFTYGNGTVRHAVFKKNKQPITFNACKKYRLLGIMLQEEWYFAQINLEGEPIIWFYDEPATDNKNYPEATQFEVVGAANVYWDKPYEERGPYEKYRQYWLMDNDDVATVSFKVLSPVGYYWLVEVVDPDNAFVVTGNGTAEGGLKGLIQNKNTVGEDKTATEIYTTTNVTLKIKAANATDTDEHKLYLKTYAVSADGTTKYSLDSETQTYDLVVNPSIGPRGYHYFVLNNSTIVTD